MNILDKLWQALGSSPDIKLGYLPDEPDELSVLTEYSGSPPSHSFGSTDFTENVQLRTRGENSYETISSLASALNGYRDGEISVIQVTYILERGAPAGFHVAACFARSVFTGRQSAFAHGS